MANINSPSGLSPVRTITGAPFNEQGQLFAIANDASNSYAIGDVVVVAGGSDDNGTAYVTKMLADSDTPLGVIVGIQQASASNSLEGTTLALNQIYLPVNSGLRYVYVVTDPQVIYEVQDTVGASAGNIGSNAGMDYTADQTSLSMSSPQSSTVVKHSTIAALTEPGSADLPLQILGLSQKANNTFGAYSKLLVTFNRHQYKQAAGTPAA